MSRQALIQGLSATPEQLNLAQAHTDQALTNDEIVQEAQFAWTMFQDEYADLLSCFDTSKLFQTISDEGALAGPSEGILKSNYHFREIVTFIEKNFVTLLDRGALDSLQKFGLSKAAQAQLAAMEEKVRAVAPTASASAPPEPVVSEAGQCASDFKTMPADKFRAKWLGAKRYIYEQAFQAGKI